MRSADGSEQQPGCVLRRLLRESDEARRGRRPPHRRGVGFGTVFPGTFGSTEAGTAVGSEEPSLWVDSEGRWGWKEALSEPEGLQCTVEQGSKRDPSGATSQCVEIISETPSVFPPDTIARLPVARPGSTTDLDSCSSLFLLAFIFFFNLI